MSDTVPSSRDSRALSYRAGSAVVALATVLALALFAGKAYTVDDPLFLWLAEHVQEHPLDFFGFTVNWYGTQEPMWAVTKNPPLMGYVLALAAVVVGWSERALHLVCILPAVAAALGTLRLARATSQRPVEAALIAIFSPVFLVSSTNVMCDTLMLALWVWAVIFFREGLDGRRGRLPAAAVSIALAGLTKYFALALLPLLFVYGLHEKRRLGAWTAWLCVPVAVFVAYQLGTEAAYGRGLLTDAAGYAGAFQLDGRGPSLVAKAFVGLVFAGGCLAPVVFLAPLLWTWRGLAIGLLLTSGFLGVQLGTDVFAGIDTLQVPEVGPGLAAQRAVLATAGVGVLALVLRAATRARDADTWLLVLWVAGTFVFAAFVNWSENGRSNLPMAPAFGILAVRGLRARSGRPPRGLQVGLAVAALFGLLVADADRRWSDAARRSARELAQKSAGGTTSVRFQGHWGLQYYLERAGLESLDLLRDTLAPGDLLLLPTNNTDVRPPPEPPVCVPVAEVVVPNRGLLHTFSKPLGASFYAASGGPMPFAFGAVPDETVQVWEVRQRFRYPPLRLNLTPEER